ncbi:hypothetical protein MBLNU230_g8161t1 [Neophaeotheca triangularis]
MPVPWYEAILEFLLPIAVLISTVFTIFLVTLPKPYSSFQDTTIQEEDFTKHDKANQDESGYAWYQQHKDGNGSLKPGTSIQILVLGDIGRSPRMQYHALSVARHGGIVQLIGYVESDIHPSINASRLITVIPIKPFPSQLQTSNKLLFLLTAPLKVLWQTASLYYALGYATHPSKWMLVQNPPSIPTLAVARAICFLRRTRLIIDWHNFGYSILALRLGPTHPLTRIAKWYEGFIVSNATAHFAVTRAMCRVLEAKWKVQALPLHDRPPLHFQPITPSQRQTFLTSNPTTAPFASSILANQTRLLVSSTSWTPDEDFTLLLEALVTYSAASTTPNSRLPSILAIITGKGPQQAHYLAIIARLQKRQKLQNVTILTAWLSAADYASLLGSADLGISLHTSSSGVDLPMKVVDMFGTGLPVAGWSGFEAWPELVTEGVNGVGFESAERLAEILERLFEGDGAELKRLREGAGRECERRWEGEWMPVAGKLLELPEV